MSLKTSNVFAALDAKKGKKKKGDKDHKKKKSGDREPVSAEELERAIFSQPQLSITSWADEEDEDDEYGHLQDLPESWSQQADGGHANGSHPLDDIHEGGEESEEEVDIDDELGVELGHDEDEEQEEEKEDEGQAEAEADASTKPGSALANAKYAVEPEKQLSKKELKKKELQELDAVFAEFGIAIEEKGGEAAAAAESKRKKKEKKDKPQSANGVASEPASRPSVTAQAEHSEAEEPSADAPVDPLKAKAKLAALKKKTDPKKKSASATALAEAKLRAKKLGKSKDTKNYNQAPTR